jgi:23S rRNA A2030 N6-methylase RlmJ
MSAKSASKERVRFIFEPDRASPNGITYSWLIHKTYDGKEKAATATRAFWLPFAYRDKGDASEAELRELAQQSVWRMEEQIQHLREAFGLENSQAIAQELSSSPTPSEAESSTWSASFAAKSETGLLDEFSEVL